MTDDHNNKLLNDATQAIESLRSKGCHIHSITNTVAQNFTANVLLACGASVSMTANRDEMRGFLDAARALHINLGTIDPERIKAIREAVKAATELEIPILLDPVMIHRSQPRRDLAIELAGYSTVIKGNQQEVAVLSAEIGEKVCLIETGSVDLVKAPEGILQVSNGVPMMDKVIATGCALGALITALLPHASSPMAASVAGLLWFSIAGERANAIAAGPGTFQAHFLDCLHTLSMDEIQTAARLS